MNGLEDTVATGLLSLWVVSVAALLLMAAASGWFQSAEKLAVCWRVSERLLLGCIAAAGLVGGWLVLESLGAVPVTAAGVGFSMGLSPDGLAVWMAMMVAFIGWVILRYADSYLRNDQGRERFLPWLLVIIGSVSVLVTTNHLLILAGAWVAVSLALHHLLTLYPNRPQAKLAAVQKFIVSRIGDALIFAGVSLLYAHHGTFLLPEIIAKTAAGQGVGEYPWWAAVAFALAAALKCAQIPFHGWLLRVMEAPTPVSAVLHAGVINLGGFLWLRLFPVFDGFTAGHLILLVVGGVTAVVAVLTMMTQPSVKHALAWSTCAQMGFMLFEIGMGAYTLALLHLLAHSLYKAHSFLASGRTVVVSAGTGFPPAARGVRLSRALITSVVAAGILVAFPALVQNNPVLGAVLVMAVGAAAFGIPGGSSRFTAGRLCVLALALVPVYSLLHGLLAPALPTTSPIDLPLSAYIVGSTMVLALVLGTVFTHLSTRRPLVRQVCTHFRHGLYLQWPFDRVTRALAAGSLQTPTLFRPSHPQPQRVEERS